MEMDMDTDMYMDLDKLAEKYFHVPKEEIEMMRRESATPFCFWITIKPTHDRTEMEKQHGRPAFRTGCLAYFLSVTVQPSKLLDKQVALHGGIHAEFIDAYERHDVHEIYTRGPDDPEILGTLTLNGPDILCWPDNAGMPLLGSTVNVDLFDQTKKAFATASLRLDDIDDDYEQVKSVVVPCEQCSLTLNYIAIPFGVHCRLSVIISNMKDFEKHDIVNVNGKIVARYVHTYGNCSSQEVVLFNKQDTEFTQVEIDKDIEFPLTRCWVSLPAYSSLIIEVYLSEFGSDRKIVNGIIKLLPEQAWRGWLLLEDDMFITVNASRFSPQPPLARNDYRFSDDGDDDDDNDDDDDDESSIDDDVSSIDNESPSDESGDVLSSPFPRSLRSHKNKPRSSPAVEIFSVFIGREKSKAVQIYGSIEVLYDDTKLCCIFKRDEKYAFGLSENLKSIPISDGSRVFHDCSSLEIKFDIKDAEGCLAIKGYVYWAASTFDTYLWYEKHLCSLIQGQHGGFAAVHYSIFDQAVGVNIKVSLNLKTRGSEVNPKVWGSLVTQYSRYDYSSRYNKDYYRSVLFKRTRDDLIQISNDSTIPLSRSRIVVPSDSALVVNVDLSFGVSEQKLSCVEIIEIGEDFKTVETYDYLLRIELDWCEIK